VRDVGTWCARTLLDKSGQSIRSPVKLFGPRLCSALDVKLAIESIVGHPGKMIVVPRDKLPEYWSKIVPEAYVQDFVDFTTAQLPGGVGTLDYQYGEDTLKCSTELIDGLRQMAA
jgi:hypothetical protein